MCFSQYAQYAPRPVIQQEYEYEAPTRPEGAPPTKADLDENLFGPKPLPPQWQKKTGSEGNDHSHSHVHDTGPVQPAAAVHVAGAQNGNGAAAVTSVTTQTVEAVVVELSNGTKLLICPL